MVPAVENDELEIRIIFSLESPLLIPKPYHANRLAMIRAMNGWPTSKKTSFRKDCLTGSKPESMAVLVYIKKNRNCYYCSN